MDNKKLNIDIPTIRERKTKSYKIKLKISKGFIKICDFINPTNNKLYKKAMKVVERDRKVRIGPKPNRIRFGDKVVSDPHYSISDEDIESISGDFGVILSNEMDKILCNRKV